VRRNQTSQSWSFVSERFYLSAYWWSLLVKTEHRNGPERGRTHII